MSPSSGLGARQIEARVGSFDFRVKLGCNFETLSCSIIEECSLISVAGLFLCTMERSLKMNADSSKEEQ
jgi:hypothetical protein